jgi:polyribonucleotide 5'-hydroxyl-kinase
MDAYLNASHIINNQRKLAREVRAGPVVVVVGPPDSGKTSLVKILANYAIRAGWNPLLVDTSVEQNLISVPGALAAVQVAPCYCIS